MRHLIANVRYSQIAIVDIQVKLSMAMPADDMKNVIKNSSVLLQAANLMAIPVIVTEQYPQGLGETVQDLAQYLLKSKPIAKTAFSACGEPKFNQQLHHDKSQIILAGMETHICVLQTALDLFAQGKQVFVVEDAVISRDANNKSNALKRLRSAGCVITNTESVLFEWLGDANHEDFKALSKLIR
jgi:isochorismate hydrolase